MPPTTDLVPPIDVELLAIFSERVPLDARGVGEPRVAPVLAVVANAVRDTTGLRLTSTRSPGGCGSRD